MSTPREVTVAQAAPATQPQQAPAAAPAPQTVVPAAPPASRPRITIPANIKPNTTIEVRTVISHVMETGLRRDADGKVIPRNIINGMTALYQNKSVFSADLHASTSANPYVAFWLKVTEPGRLVVTWIDDKGKTVSEAVDIAFT